MFAWFQRLLPERGDFFGMFEAHATAIVRAAEALQELADNGGEPASVLQRIQEQEHRADDIIRQVLTAVRRTFLTPFDRSAITSLIGAMDDAIDEILATARALELYEMKRLLPEMKVIVGLISEAARVTADAVPLLRDVSANAGKLHQLTGKLVALEGEADESHARGLKEAFKTARDAPLEFAVSREVFKSLERVADAFEDVANEIDGIVIDHA